MWHHDVSCTGVPTTSGPVGHPLGMGGDEHRAGAAAAAARSAASVAAVPASCETPTTTPPSCGSSDASNASRATTARGPSASPSSAAPACAACSLVPQPASTTGSPAAAAARISAPASRRRGRGEHRLGQLRLGQDHLLHRPRRAGAQLGFVAHGARRYRLAPRVPARANRAQGGGTAAARGRAPRRLDRRSRRRRSRRPPASRCRAAPCTPATPRSGRAPPRAA